MENKKDYFAALDLILTNIKNHEIETHKIIKNESYNKTITQIVDETFVVLDKDYNTKSWENTAIMLYLKDEGYLTWHDSFRASKLTFKGIMFMQNGGFRQREINNSSENIRLVNLESSAMASRRFQNRLTFLIALGTLVAAVYYGIEIWKFCNPWWYK